MQKNSSEPNGKPKNLQKDGSLPKTQKELERHVQERTQKLNITVDDLKIERQRLFDVLDTLPVYVCLLTEDYHMPFANRYFRETFGEPKGRRCYDFLFDRQTPCETCETYTVMKTRAPHHWYWTGPNGRDYDIYDYPFIDSDNTFNILEMGIDITDRNRAESALQKAHDDLEIRVNDRTADLRQKNEELSEMQEELRQANEELLNSNINLNATNQELAAAQEELLQNVDEISKGAEELRQSEANLKTSLAEKEILLSEIHHRVKNNLAAFISLLSLQGSYEETPAGEALKKDLQNRARSMALIHETLYRTRQYSDVEMDVYLATLIDQIAYSYSSGEFVRTSVEAKGIKLDLARATPTGLIVNELVTNALKYGFPESLKSCRISRKDPCTVQVALSKNSGTYILRVSDNGIGLPSGLDPEKTQTLGLKLVTFLAKHQMRATIEVNTDNGTEFIFRFRE